jgi:poly-gamma-glutamate synthesis protein (capsule biosynthesis protein)
MPPGRPLSLFLGGDAIITQPWSQLTDPEFLKLIEEIRAADVAIVNLEVLIHEYKGYAQAECGGTYMAARPEIATELKWAGIDMVAHANNHTFDYGSIGVLETLENVARAGIVLAGSGKDLQEARAPRHCPVDDKTVALVAAASSFVRFGRASRSRPDMHGRPGLNPLATTSDPVVVITRRTANRLGSLSRLVGYRGGFRQSSFSFSHIKFRVGPAHRIQLRRRAIDHGSRWKPAGGPAGSSDRRRSGDVIACAS